MLDEFEKFAQQIGRSGADKPVHGRILQCPHCKEFLSDTYLEENPFSEVPCPACGSLVALQQAGDIEDSSMDKRAEKRCPASLPVSYRTFSEFMDEYTKNVSRRGMFIKTKRHHTIGETADLLLHVPGLPDPVRIKGEIVHVETDAVREEDCGVGVKFIDIDDTSREALIAFIKSREDCQ